VGWNDSIDVYAIISSSGSERKIEDINMRLLAFKKLTVALAIASVGATALVTRAMAQTPSEPRKLTGSAALYAEGQDTQAKQADAFFDNYRFRNGEVIDRLRLHFATLGEPHHNAAGDVDNAVLVLHWTDASGGALLTPNYIKALFAPGRPLDARRYFLIFPDNVGHGLSSKPSDGLRAKFPRYGYNDMVDLQHRLVAETLGIKHLHAILGMSMGGMNAWQWAEAYPDAMDGIMPVVALPTRVSGRNLLWRRIVMDGIRTDPEWKDGNYDAQPANWMGYAVVRMMIDGVQHLQTEIPDGAAADRFMAGLRQQSRGIDANDTLYALQSSADYDPQPKLDTITTKVLALNFDDDAFNPEELHILHPLMSKVRNGRAVVQAGSDKSFGHLTMAHPELWANHVADFMRELGDEPK
jgi:homoserine O-acetyltransferase/O-succinyltransferase